MMPAKAVPVEQASAAPEPTVDTISDYKSFLKLEGLWNDLIEKSGIDHPFLTHEWIRTWWKSFGSGKKLHVLVVKSGDEAIAIAPLMLSQERIYGFKVRRLGSIDNAHTPRFDFIIARCPEAAYRAVWSCLLKQREQWDVLELNQLPSASRTLEELPRLARADKFLIGTWRSEDCPYLELADGWEAYLKRLSSNLRSLMRKRLKRLSRLGEVRLEVISSQEELKGALADGLRMEMAGWKGEAETAILSWSHTGEFYVQMAIEASRRGILRLLFLNVGGTRIAFAYTLCYKNKLYALKAGYQPEYAVYSPYNLLCYLVLQDACERGLAEYEFLGGSDEWKLHWTTQTRPHCWLYILPQSLRARLIHAAKFRLVPTLKRNRLYLLVWNAGLLAAKRFMPDLD